MLMKFLQFQPEFHIKNINIAIDDTFDVNILVGIEYYCSFMRYVLWTSKKMVAESEPAMVVASRV